LHVAFSLLIIFVFSLVVALTRKIALKSLWRMVAEVNWERCHHHDRWSSVHPNCRMVAAKKVSEQVVPMMASETMAAPAPGGFSEIHHSRGF
jgi:hypothetical protein